MGGSLGGWGQRHTGHTVYFCGLVLIVWRLWTDLAVHATGHTTTVVKYKTGIACPVSPPPLPPAHVTTAAIFA